MSSEHSEFLVCRVWSLSAAFSIGNMMLCLRHSDIGMRFDYSFSNRWLAKFLVIVSIMWNGTSGMVFYS